MTTKETEEMKGTTKSKMARRHSKEREKYLEEESNRQRTIEGIDGKHFHYATDGKSLGER